MLLYHLALVLLYQLWPIHTAITKSSYRAAVYEHLVILPPQSCKAVSREDALELMRRNLAIYEVQARLAKEQGTDILVFPENGIYGMAFSTRKAISPYLESIPDPQKVRWSPCSDSTRFNESEVQHELSCMAKNNSIHVVANIGDKVVCDRKEDRKCPDDGQYQFNTVVVYDTTGTLIAKYHKHHLFYEYQFDTPEPRAVYFDTPYGRFGIVVCFDLLFKNPAVSLVLNHNVSNILLPTAWMDALPLLPAIGYHSSFARGLGVNLLGSNVHWPAKRFHGSGIYTPKGVASFYYNNSLRSSPKLLISDIDVVTEPSFLMTVKDPEYSEHITFPNVMRPDEHFQAYLFHDLYTFRLLQGPSGEMKICDSGVCCFLNYEIKDQSDTHVNRDVFALGAFDGLHTYDGQYYMQVCTLTRCANSQNISSCGSTTFDSSTIFKSLYLMGTFKTMFIHPQVILSSEGQLELAASEEWNFTKRSDSVKLIESHAGFRKSFLSATLLGRDYSRDATTITTSLSKGLDAPATSQPISQKTTDQCDNRSAFPTRDSPTTTLGLGTQRTTNATTDDDRDSDYSRDATTITTSLSKGLDAPATSQPISQKTTDQCDNRSAFPTRDSPTTTLGLGTQRTTNATTDDDRDSCHAISVNLYYILLVCVLALVFMV